MTPHTGRFAPSPTGPLHAGSLVAALASWLDARAHSGQWLVRIEDVDTTRCLPGVDRTILGQLEQCGLHSDLPPLYQSQRSATYQQALESLVQCGLAYPCACTRQQIQAALAQHGTAKPRHGELIYPGTCRSGLHGAPARAWRLRTDMARTERTEHVEHDAASSCENRLSLRATTRNPWIPDQVRDDSQGSVPGMTSTATAAPDLTPPTSPLTSSVSWFDRRLGAQQQDVASQVGDFILKRADGCYAYQLAVVLDDAAQGITDVVRGEDLADNTARQILLQRALGLPTPRYLHTPLVLDDNGEKLSKQNGAAALNLHHPLTALNHAAQALGLSPQAGTVPEALLFWTHQWKTLW